jgi:hypothetical protein
LANVTHQKVKLETKLAIVTPPTEKLEANFANMTAQKAKLETKLADMTLEINLANLSL